MGERSCLLLRVQSLVLKLKSMYLRRRFCTLPWPQCGTWVGGIFDGGMFGGGMFGGG